MEAVRDRAVWGAIGTLFLGSALLFLINIYFGFDNALLKLDPDLTAGVIPRWQVLTHLHSGTLGWITLSIIGFSLWIFTGQREVSSTYARNVRILVAFGLVAFIGYIASFATSFYFGDTAFFLLPIFGTLSALVIWTALAFFLMERRHQPTVTTVHVLLLGALVVASVGALMGILVGLEHILGAYLPIIGPDRVGIHAGMMDTYLFLGAAAIVEWSLQSGPPKRWTGVGLVQALAWTIAALGVVAFFLSGLFPLLIVFVVLLLLAFGLFLARAGRHALARNPFRGTAPSWMFFGTLWLIVFTITFIVIALSGVDPATIPPWVGVLFIHSAMVGMMSNLLLGVYAARTETVTGSRVADQVAMWLLNGGLVAFVALRAIDYRWGAVIMGVGVLLGVLTMIFRLLVSRSSESGAGGSAG